MAKSQESFDGRLEEAKAKAKAKEKEAATAKLELEETKKKFKESELEGAGTQISKRLLPVVGNTVTTKVAQAERRPPGVNCQWAVLSRKKKWIFTLFFFFLTAKVRGDSVKI